jgi:hypothetical protein
VVLDGRVNAGLTCAMIHDLITAFLVAFAAVTASNCSSRFGSSSSRSVRRGVSRRPPGTLRPARHIHSKATSEAALIVIAGPRSKPPSWRFAPLPPRGKESFLDREVGGPWWSVVRGATPEPTGSGSTEKTRGMSEWPAARTPWVQRQPPR